MARVMSMPTAVPTLDELAADPERATALPRATIQTLLHRCVGVQTILLGALTASEKTETEADTLIDVDAAAQRLGASKDWIYHNARHLPFVVRNGRLLRFSSRGIDRYIRTRQGV
jgi:predicted DNA-binding transcriptional regulator AlpA